MSTVKIIFITLTLLFLFSCVNKESTTIISLNALPVTTSQNEIINTWIYVSDNVYVSCFIKVNSDSTFNYENTGCMGTTYTSGKWTLKGNQLVLNSFNTYAPKQTKIYYEEKSISGSAEVLNPGSTADTSTSHQFTITINPSVLTTSFVPCNINSDSLTTYFINRIFTFKNDTLYELTGNMGIQNGSKFCALKKQFGVK